MRFLLSLLLITTPVGAHDWFAGKHDKSGASCCSGKTDKQGDCREVPEDMDVVKEVQGGFQVTLTEEQFKYFAYVNTGFHGPLNEFIPWERVQPSETGRFAICLSLGHVTCFFAPLNT